MNKRIYFLAVALAVVVALPALAQSRAVELDNFASDFQTVPVKANTQGIGGGFTTFVSILNPTASAFVVEANLYDSAGTRRTANISLAAGEQKVYANFLSEVFNYTGGGAVTFRAPDSPGGQRNNRFVVNAEVRTSGTNYSTQVPALEFAGSNARSFTGAVTVDSTYRTNIGCFNQSDVTNSIKATILDSTGKQTLGTQTITLAPNAWTQTAVNTIVVGGYIQFEPSEAAACYAVVVNNLTNDGRFSEAAEYRP